MENASLATESALESTELHRKTIDNRDLQYHVANYVSTGKVQKSKFNNTYLQVLRTW